MSAPRDEQATDLLARVDDATAETARHVFTVTRGGDQGVRFDYDVTRPPRVLAGLSPACEFRLSDPHVSRRHAAFDLTTRGLRITDLQSTNGTFVNGVPVEAAFLRGGEVVTLGQTDLRVDMIPYGEPNTFSTATRFGRMLGVSREMRRLYPRCERLAATDLSIIIEGETGTGKEVLAEAIHEASGRAGAPYVVCDCTAIAATLAESTLFGHERGAFTGADAPRKGVFEHADGGTVLIDEIGELDHALQPKLLRVLERGEVQRVGSNRWIKVDVRIIAATRADLDREVQAGRFRDDLFYRLAVGRIELPPLRRRQGDVAVLARHFWRTLGGTHRPIPHEILQRFEDYAWPGNVRELYHAVARVLALGEDSPDESDAEDGAEAPRKDIVMDEVLELDLPLPRARQRVVEEFERRYVERVLKKYDGNVMRAAAASGLARRYFQILKARRGK